MTEPSPRDDLDRDGFAVVPGVLDEAEVDALAAAIDGAEVAGLRREGRLYGMRDALRAVPEVGRASRSGPLLELARAVVGPGAFPVRALLFDKSPGANWGVAPHQDLTIAVQDRVETPGYGPWTVRAGIVHVRPPVDVLAAMVTIRVHLDDSGPDNGPLRIVPGSHLGGRLDDDATRGWLDRRGMVDCPVGRGGVLLMRPLVIHASSPANRPGRRRVVHVEYAAGPLAGGLQWAEIAIGV